MVKHQKQFFKVQSYTKRTIIITSIEPELKILPSATRQEKNISKKKQNCHYLPLRYLSTQTIQGNLQINGKITKFYRDTGHKNLK